MKPSLPILLVALLTGSSALAQDLPDPSTATPAPTPTPTPAPSTTPIPAPPPTPDADLPDLARPTPVPPPPHQSRVFGGLELGYAYATLYGISMNAADVSGFAGVDLGSWGIGLQADVMPGQTQGGLDTFAFTLGSMAEAHVERVRIGGGVRLGVFNVTRATTSGSLATATAGIVGRISYDLVRLDDEGDSALFLVAKGSADAAGDALFTVTLGAGARF